MDHMNQDWIDDDSITAAEAMARFNALEPSDVRGPDTSQPSAVGEVTKVAITLGQQFLQPRASLATDRRGTTLRVAARAVPVAPVVLTRSAPA